MVVKERDYKLDQGFLPHLISEYLIKDETEDLQIKLPATVQILEVDFFLRSPFREKWYSYRVMDGEFALGGTCAFLSAQPPPRKFSIIKITKVSRHLPIPVHRNILGQIDFEIVSSEIGHCLYQEYEKTINFVHIQDKALRWERKGYCPQEISSNLLELLNLVDRHSIQVMKKMWREKEERFCDVSFTFSAPDQEKKAFAHKSVLISSSDVFKAHFNREHYYDGNSVHIVDTSFYYFNKLLEFIYTEKTQFANIEVAFELLYLAKKYLLPLLEKHCQETIFNHYGENEETILRLMSKNQKSNDKRVQDFFTGKIEHKARRVLNSEDFLQCDYGTVEWILSLDKLHIDEWSLLCALYKWAWNNGVTAFCQGEDDGTECLHGLLECIRFSDIDGKSLQRFFKLPKLAEMVQVDELMKTTFAEILECVTSFNHKRCSNISTFGRSFSTFRDDPAVEDYFFMEVLVKNDFKDHFEKTSMDNLHLRDGSVLGLEVNIVPDISKAFKVNVCFSFKFLYSTNVETEHTFLRFGILVNDLKNNSLSRLIQDVTVGEPFEFAIPLQDIRDHLTDKIEDTGVEAIEDSEWEKVLCLEIEITQHPHNGSPIRQ